MLYLNKRNTWFIIALNSYLTAVLLIPKHLKFHSSYCRVKLIKVNSLNYRIRQVGRTLLGVRAAKLRSELRSRLPFNSDRELRLCRMAGRVCVCMYVCTCPLVVPHAITEPGFDKRPLGFLLVIHQRGICKFNKPPIRTNAK